MFNESSTNLDVSNSDLVLAKIFEFCWNRSSIVRTVQCIEDVTMTWESTTKVSQCKQKVSHVKVCQGFWISVFLSWLRNRCCWAFVSSTSTPRQRFGQGLERTWWMESMAGHEAWPPDFRSDRWEMFNSSQPLQILTVQIQSCLTQTEKEFPSGWASMSLQLMLCAYAFAWKVDECWPRPCRMDMSYGGEQFEAGFS